MTTTIRPDSDHDRWILAAVQPTLAAISPTPTTVVEICADPRLDPTDLERPGTTSIDLTTATVADSGRLEAKLSRSAHFDLAVSVETLAHVGDDLARQRLITEHVRVADRVVMVNLDWSMVEGGPASNRLRDLTTSALSEVGVNPYYGLLQQCEATLVLGDEFRVTTETVTIDPTLTGELMVGRAGELMVEMAERVLASAQLDDRHQDFAEELIAATRREVECGLTVRLPDITITQIDQPAGD